MNPIETYNFPQRQRILSIARTALGEMLTTGDVRPAQPAADEQFLHQPRGCFVTLHHRHGHLRGCIGTFDASDVLHRNIVRMTAASTRDPRFTSNPVVLAEYNDLIVEVSVLTPMQRIADPRQMRLGVDGIYIKSNRQNVSGCFLPQVATEQKWNVEQTLSYCCAHKMGLSSDIWKSPASALEFFVFQSIIISEAVAHGSAS